ncbi:MAG: glycine cleavage system aminomethyltransferase GcvT [Fuerstiella sp.]|nr:glycine cleavage system aminomethyltransferase GcvT [Fuerstiella sp.]
MDDLRRSPLHDTHVQLGARMVPFAGWEMPVQYEGIIPENRAVRQKLGVFDISHMGQLFVSSDKTGVAADWLDSILTNNVAKLDVGQGQYTLLLNETGGVIDDLIVYRQSDTEYFLVVNASKVDEDVSWMQTKLPASGVSLTNRSDEFAGLAVQGPEAVTAFQAMFGKSQQLPERFCMSTITTDNGNVIICRTGYTGEDGFELFCPTAAGSHWWQQCIDAGATPAGLGARDSLRLEKCYPLNGNDLAPDRTPLEAGLAFAVDLHKPEFVGRETLVRQKTKGLHRRLVAIKQTEKSPPPRPGYSVLSGDQEVGTLSSGGVSPNLGCGISMAYITSGHNKIGTALDVEIRGKRFPAEVVRKPFI